MPVAFDVFALPHRQQDRMKAELGIFAQDQWTIDRLTVNYGLRFDYVNMFSPEQNLPAGPLVPERHFAAVHKIPEWKDFNPRVGMAYDLFGNGRTALKMSLGRYGDLTGSSLTRAANPVSTSVSTARRSWNDTNGNYVPDCNLANFASNGECGPISDSNFGKNNPLATQYADDVMRGWGVRSYIWDVTTELQHELFPGLSVTGGYYRNWEGNYRVTDNVAVTPDDYDPYCITAPVDPRLPGGGGYEVCGLYDLKPEKFGQVTNVVTQASNFGEQSRVADFFAVQVNGRFARGIRIGGGLDTGRQVMDQCLVVDSPQQLLHCRVETPFSGYTQIKINASVPLPAGFVASALYQNQPGPVILADYEASTAEIAPSLGRNLAGGARTASVPLIAPQTQFENRMSQLDLRVSKTFTAGGARLQANLDLYNALNANPVLELVNTFGSRWQRPLTILDARLLSVSGQLTW